MKNIRIIVPVVLGLMICSLILGCGNVSGGGGGGGGGGASVIYVATTGSDETGDGSAANPYRTIQKGLNSAGDNCVVSVASGEYNEQLSWPLTAEGITLSGESSSNTIVSADALGRCLTIKGISTPQTIYIYNITLSHGRTSETEGAGIAILTANTNVAAANVSITDNTDTADGGMGAGIFMKYNSDNAYLYNCVISRNSIPNGKAGYGTGNNGAGVYAYGIFHAVNTEFSGNTASGVVGGGLVNYAGNVTLEACSFFDNSADRGGAIETYGGNTKIVNCIIFNNEAIDAVEGEGGGIFCNGPTTIMNCTIASNEAEVKGGAISRAGSTVNVVNSILWDNNAPTSPEAYGSSSLSISYSDIKGGFTGTGNVDSDPAFTSDTDFHLTNSTSSIVYEGGTLEAMPSSDLDGNTRPHSNHPDNCSMGAYEFDSTL